MPYVAFFDQDSAKGIIWDYTKVSSASCNPASAPDFRFTSALVSYVAASSPETHTSSRGKRLGSSWKEKSSLKEEHNCMDVRFGIYTVVLTHPDTIQTELSWQAKKLIKEITADCKQSVNMCSIFIHNAINRQNIISFVQLFSVRSHEIVRFLMNLYLLDFHDLVVFMLSWWPLSSFEVQSRK